MDIYETKISPETLSANGFKRVQSPMGRIYYIRNGIAVMCIDGLWTIGGLLHDEPHFEQVYVEYIEQIP